MDSELYEAGRLDDLKAYIEEKAKDLNGWNPRCTPLSVRFEQYNTNNHYLVGFETAQFYIKAAHLIDCNSKI